nr:reverse transcriptase [Danio rerio]
MESTAKGKSYWMARRPVEGATEGSLGRVPFVTRDPKRKPEAKRTLTHGLGLRECSVVLTRLIEGRRGRDHTPSGWNAQRGMPNDESSVEEPNGPIPSNPIPTGTQALPEPMADGEQGEHPGVVVTLPLRDLNCPLCGGSASTAVKVQRHLAFRHGTVPVRFSCESCGKTSPGCHSVLCHIPKCRGPTGEPPEKVVKCEGCSRTFGTRRACSIHEMHVHSEIRNRKRIAQDRQEKGTSTDGEGRAGVERADAGEGPSGEGIPPKRPRRARTPREPSEPPANPPILSPQPDLPPGGLRDLLREVASGWVRAARDGGTVIDSVLAAWLDGNDRLPELVDAATQRTLQGLPAGRLARRPATFVAPNRRRGRWGRRLKLLAKRRAYHDCQIRFRKDPARLAANILDGKSETSCPINEQAIHEHFRNKWANPSPFGGLGRFGTENRANNAHLLGPISKSEVQTSLRNASNASTPGPDGVGKRDISNWDPECETLTQLFNMWWFTGVIPSRLKKSRTVLLPKSSDPGAEMEIGNWRPITIGSMVLRLFTRVINTRLTEACPLHPRQRGFRRSPGCSENLEVLECLLRHSKEKRSQLAVVFVDFAQAFDTVSHEHMLSVLEQMNVDPHMVNLIREIYTNSCTSVELGRKEGPDIPVRVGVKQGDPLSPLLFNLALDPLIQSLERTGKGCEAEGHKVTALAFADDLALVAGSWEGMAHNLALVDEFCLTTGLTVQPKKCHSFMVRPCRGAFTVNDCPPWVLGGKALQLTNIENSIKYLGVKVNPWAGIEKPDLTVALDRWCKRIGKSLLKPSQKVYILNQFAIPRLFYLADHGGAGDVMLQNLDGTIRKAVKKWLHLPPSTCNGLLYARNCNGGLGICKLTRHIPSMQARRMFRLANSSDPLMKAMMRGSRVEQKFKKAWMRAGGEESALPRVFGANQYQEGEEVANDLVPRCPMPSDWRLEEFQHWMGLPIQGVGIAGFFRNRVANGWLRKPAGFKERHYIAALQLRACVYPTLEFQQRGRSKAGAACRRCSSRLESSSHILGKCPAVQGARIRRHNKICDLLKAEAETRGWEVRREWAFRTPAGELRRLDLVLILGDEALVIDVTVRYEFAPDTLQNAGKDKVSYYGPHKEAIARELGVRRVDIHGFPLGARGLWLASNSKVLELMGLSRERVKVFSRLLSRRVLLYSIDIMRTFYATLQ